MILTALRTERDHRAALTFQKVKVYPFKVDSPEAEYSKLLTPYAFTFVHNQMKLMIKVKEIKDSPETSDFSGYNKGGTTSLSCSITHTDEMVLKLIISYIIVTKS